MSTDKPATRKGRNIPVSVYMDVHQLSELRALSVVTQRPVASYQREGVQMMLDSYAHFLGDVEIERSPLK